MMSTILALFVLIFAILSFIFGLVASLKTPDFGTPVITKDGVSCKFSNDPVVIFGYLSVAFLVVSGVVGCLSLFYPFKGKSPRFSKVFDFILTFIGLATACSLLWATISIHLLQHKVHHDLINDYACPSAGTCETTLVIGAMFSLVLGIIWSLMVLAREDLFHKVNDVNGGEI
ncbi:uncharacterized protein LOC130732177 [Lotus japonicus]|uniref:uncharacterized protein LOC130732177 n=1 Tax=Lotus japonicus TaxID=34305 RepID=UPI0025882EFF|nr:uncharacterized protein LOC130732177 [Lotus japonicus]